MPHRVLHPQLRILLMRPQHEALHRRLSRLAHSQPLVKNAFQSELGEALVGVDGSSHFEEAVGWTGAVGRVERRVAAPDQDGGGSLREHDEVISYFGAGFVGRGEELGFRPELVAGSLGVFVFGAEV